MSALNNRSIQNSLGVISNALAGGGIALNLCEANVAFCYEDSPKAATRHSSVNIPNADFSDKGNMEIAEGQAVHESLHHIFSDPEAKSMLTKDAFSGFRNNVFDSAEDAYIEDMGQRKWRGIRKVLNRRLVHYKRKCFFQKTEELEVIELIEQYIYCFMSVERNNATPLDSLYSQAKFRMIMELGFENFDHLNELLPNGLKTTSSLENVEFAESIANWLKGLIPNQPQQQQQQQPEPNKDKQGDTSDGENQQGDTGESQQGESGEDKQGDTSDGENQQGDTGESQQGESGEDKQGDTSDGENQQGDTGESQQGESGEDKQGDTSDGENQQGDTGESQQGQSGEDKQGDTSSGENQQSQSSSTQGGDQGQLGNQNSAQPFSQQQSGASSNKSNQQNQNIDENDIQALTPEKISQIQKDAGNKSDSLAQTLAQKALKELDASANNESIETCKNLEMRDNGKRFSFVREMRQLEGAIRRPLQAMLLAQTWRNESFGRKGELDTSRIHRVVTDGKAMRQETIIEGENSAVSILVDASTSMDDKAVKGNPFSLSRMQVAEITVGAMTNVLSSLNIPVEAWKFASSSSTGPAVSAYKLFNEKPNQMMGKLGRAPKGGTPTGEALFTIIANISKRHEPKKIVYVITDGEANKGGVMLKKAYEMSEAVGVKVKFICVGTKWKYHFAQEFVAEIEQATELPRLMQRMSLKDL